MLMRTILAQKEQTSAAQADERYMNADEEAENAEESAAEQEEQEHEQQEDQDEADVEISEAEDAQPAVLDVEVVNSAMIYFCCLSLRRAKLFWRDAILFMILHALKIVNSVWFPCHGYWQCFSHWQKAELVAIQNIAICFYRLEGWVKD